MKNLLRVTKYWMSLGFKLVLKKLGFDTPLSEQQFQLIQDILSYLFIVIMYVHLVFQVYINYTALRYDKAAHLFIVALVYLISHTDKYREPPQKKVVELVTEEETDELCDEWTPESLVPSLTEYTQREPQVLQSAAGPHTVINGKSAVNFASADYLGLLGHKKLLDSCISAVEEYGVGSCGPRGFYGSVDVHLDCEARIARFMGTSDSILYSYGLATMFSVLEFHCQKTRIIVVDEGVHWGIQNGLLLTRNKTIVYFKHNDMISLENVLIDNLLKRKRAKKCFIVIEAVYQNSGQIARLDEIIRLKEKYKCRVMMDESNSFGVLGHSGRGLSEYYGIPIGKIDVMTATLGHALASEGGFCTGSFCDNSGCVQDQRLGSKGYVFSASLPPYLSCAAMSALDVLEENPNLIQQLNDNITFLRAGLSSIQGLEVVSSPDSPLVFLKLTQSTGATETDFQLLQDIADQVLEEHGVYVAVSKRSTIDTCPLPIGIRLCVSAGHSKSDLTKLCHSLKTVCRSSINKS